MGTVADAITAQPVDRKLLSEALAWPKDSERLYVEIVEDLFVDGDVKVLIECSFDGGGAYRLISTDTFEAGFRSRDGGPRYIVLGPFKTGEEIDNPTHVRIAMEPSKGIPICGLKSNVELAS